MFVYGRTLFKKNLFVRKILSLHMTSQWVQFFRMIHAFIFHEYRKYSLLLSLFYIKLPEGTRQHSDPQLLQPVGNVERGERMGTKLNISEKNTVAENRTLSWLNAAFSANHKELKPADTPPSLSMCCHKSHPKLNMTFGLGNRPEPAFSFMHWVSNAEKSCW